MHDISLFSMQPTLVQWSYLFFFWLFLFSLSYSSPSSFLLHVDIIHCLALCADSSISLDDLSLFRTCFSLHDYDSWSSICRLPSLLIWDLNMKLLDRKYLKPGMIKPKVIVFTLKWFSLLFSLCLSLTSFPYLVMISGNSPLFCQIPFVEQYARIASVIRHKSQGVPPKPSDMSDIPTPTTTGIGNSYY